MLTVTLCALALQSGQSEITAARVISNMLEHYYSAKTLQGTIKSVVKDDAGTVEFTTEVAYERPSKIYVSQNRKGRNGLDLLLVSDGERFSYDPPRNTPVRPKPNERLYEPVTVKHLDQTWSHKIGDIYAIGHSSLEFCVTLDLVVSHDVHLLEFKNMLASYKLDGYQQVQGQNAYRITGEWRQSINAVPTGSFVILVGPTFEILSFSLKEKYQVAGKTVSYTQTETPELRIGVPVRQDLFRVK